MASLRIKRTAALGASLGSRPRAGADARAARLVGLELAGSPGSHHRQRPRGRHLGGARGIVNPEKKATSYWFEYGSTNKYSSKTTPINLPAEPAERVDVSQTVTDMQNGWRYHLVAEAEGKKAEGKERIYVAKPTKKTTKTTKTGFELPRALEPTPVDDSLWLSGTLTAPGNADRQIVLPGNAVPLQGRIRGHRRTGADERHGRLLLPSAAALDEHAPARRHGRRAVDAQRRRNRAGHGAGFPEGAHRSQQERPRADVWHGLAGGGRRARLLPAQKAPKEEPITSVRLEKPGKSEHEKPPTFADKFSTVVKRATKSMSRFSLPSTRIHGGEQLRPLQAS